MSFNFTPLTDASVPLSRKPQIASLIAKEAFMTVLAKYTNFADLFSSGLVFKLPKHTRINNHTIELKHNYQPPYGPMYSLKPVEFETLKAYIEANLANRFIILSKSSVITLIIFDRKLNGFFWLCVDYKDLNNLTIKNWYPLTLIEGLSNRLNKTKQFT